MSNTNLEFKGTKGEWSITDDSDLYGSSRKDILLSSELNGRGIRTTIATLHGLEDGVNNNTAGERMEANAKLIAAAPELLSAAKWAVMCLESLAEEMGQIGDSGDQALQALEQAIEKALK